MVKELTQLERINHLEHICSKILSHQLELSSKFAYFWYDEKRRMIGVVTQIKGDKADMMAISNSWSGGFMQVEAAPLLVRDPDKPDDEHIKSGKWEPLLPFDDILTEAIARLKATDSEEPEAEEKKASFKLGNKATANAGTSG